MTDIGRELGAQSYTFRNFKDNQKVAALHKECGLKTTELSGVHANFSDPGKLDAVIEVYRKAGIEIVSIGVQGMRDDEAAESKFFECAKRAGAKFMSVDFNVDKVPASFRTAEKLADKFDILLAIHNHGGRHWLGSCQMLRHVFASTSPRIGLCLDTAWALAAREDPVKMAEEFGARLYGMHVKDFVFDRVGKPEDVVVGTGALNLPGLIAAAKKVNFNGYAVLEYEGDVENPAPAVKKCVAAVRAASAAK
jgi:sugar phosphate isomerase/epimerase